MTPAVKAAFAHGVAQAKICSCLMGQDVSIHETQSYALASDPSDDHVN
jgi:hypothetical protein